MKVSNIYFNNIRDLDKNLVLSKCDPDRTLLQIFSGLVQEAELYDILKIIKSKNSDVTFLGATTSGEIIDGRVKNNGIIVSIMEFSNTYVKADYFNEQDDFILGKKLQNLCFRRIQKRRSYLLRVF